MLGDFTVEEANVICFFKGHSRNETIAELTRIMPFIEDKELADIAEGVIKRLSGMSDGAFAALDLCPEYGDHDEQEA